MRFVLGGAVAAASLGVLGASAHATAVTLDFDEVSGHGQIIGDFYNGGKSELGEGPGPNFGITFLPNDPTKTLSSAFVTCADDACSPGNNVLKVFGGSPVTSEGVTVDVAGGFRDIVEFDARMRPFSAVDLFVTDASGRPIIADQTITTGAEGGGCAADINDCPFVHFRIDFSNTGFSPPHVVANGFTFGKFFGDTIDVDNLHFSDLALPADLPPTAVPEPAPWMMMVSGLGLLGATLRRRVHRMRTNTGYSRPA